MSIASHATWHTAFQDKAAHHEQSAFQPCAKAHTVSISMLSSNPDPGDNIYRFAYRYVEEAEVDDDAEVTVDEVDDQV